MHHCQALTSARQSGTQFTHPRWMEGEVDLSGWLQTVLIAWHSRSWKVLEQQSVQHCDSDIIGRLSQFYHKQQHRHRRRYKQTDRHRERQTKGQNKSQHDTLVTLATWRGLESEPVLSQTTNNIITSDCNPGIEFSIPGSGIEKLVIPGSRFGIRLTDWIRDWEICNPEIPFRD